jgi:hypothetical protein
MSSLSLVVNVITLVVGVICLTFFVVGAIGFANTEHTVHNVSWIFTKGDAANGKTYLGLRKFYVDGDNESFSSGFKACDGRFCNACYQDGLAAFGLLIIALFFTTFVIGLSAALLAKFNVGLQIANVFASFAAGCSALVAVGLFMGDCYDHIDSAVSTDLHWGPGSILTIIGMGLMWAAVVMQLIASAIGSDVAASTAGAAGSPINRF